MKTHIKITTALMISLGSLATYAQQTPMYTHYMYNTLVVNPAYAGSRDALTATALHRSQWVGLDGAPNTQTISVHSPIISKNIGVGMSLMNDRIGPSNNTSINAHFAYRIKLNQKSKLALGVMGGADIYQANIDNLNVDQEGDPVFQNNINGRATPSFGFGMYYSRDRFYAGVSVPNLVENSLSEINEDGNIMIAAQQRHYFLIAGALFNLSPSIAFKPTTLVKLTVAAPVQLGVTTTFILMKKLHLGAMYRTGDAFGALVGLTISDQFYLGYSYDKSHGLNTFRYNSGSHEIALRYDFIFSSKKQIHTPRHF